MRKRFSDQTLWGKNKKIYDQTIGQPDLQRGRVNSVRIGLKMSDSSASRGQNNTQVGFNSHYIIIFTFDLAYFRLPVKKSSILTQ